MKFIFSSLFIMLASHSGAMRSKNAAISFLFMRQSPEIYAHMIPQDRAIINISRDKTACGIGDTER